MSICRCPKNADALKAPCPDLRKYEYALEDNPSKATIWQDGKIKIDEKFWRTLNRAAKHALIFHEIAHTETGCAKGCDSAPQGCEYCADRRAGALMKQQGYSRSATEQAFRNLRIKSRPRAFIAALEGWDA
jgi:hypothetical protein